MPKRTRTLVVAATLAATTLAGIIAAHAQVTDEHTRRPPTQGQVGEAWHRRSATSQPKTAQERAADAAIGRVEARGRVAVPNGTPAQLPVPAPTQPSRQPSWLLASLGVLAVLVAGLAVLGARRAGRRARLGQPT